MYTIEDYMRQKHYYGAHERLVVDICPTCDKSYHYVRNEDPGSVQEAIGIIDICDNCHSKYSHLFLDWYTIQQLRKDLDLPDFGEVEDKYKKEWLIQEVKGIYPLAHFNEVMCGRGKYNEFVETVIKHRNPIYQNYDYDLENYRHDVMIEDESNSYFALMARESRYPSSRDLGINEVI